MTQTKPIRVSPGTLAGTNGERLFSVGFEGLAESGPDNWTVLPPLRESLPKDDANTERTEPREGKETFPVIVFDHPDPHVPLRVIC